MTAVHESAGYNDTPNFDECSSLFVPSEDETRQFGRFELTNTMLFNKPSDVPADYIAYNPSGIYKVYPGGPDILYARVEPNRVDTAVSHLGKTVARPYMVNFQDPSTPLEPYYEAMELRGEDPSLIRVNRRLPLSGKVEKVWVVGVVDARAKTDAPSEVASMQTTFYTGKTLDQLEEVAQGPAWMKDIRLAVDADPESTRLHIWGRPQPFSGSGNISYTTVPDLSALNPQAIANAPLIHEALLPTGSGVWGGVNDAFLIGAGKYLLASHRAWMTGSDNEGRHYEAVLFGHDTVTNRIVDLGVVATADMFHGSTVKQDTTVDLHDVVFTGGGYNGRPELLTFGVGDGSIGMGRLRIQVADIRSV